jgi:hypothetical protein
MFEFEDLRFQDVLNPNIGVGRGKELKSREKIKKSKTIETRGCE